MPCGGGGIELSVLSKLLELCIFAVEIRSGAVYKFGEGKYSRTGFLIYKGLHYDAMQEGATGKRLFEAPEVAAALQDVLAIAEEARAAGQFSNRGGGSTTAVRSWAPFQRARLGFFFTRLLSGSVLSPSLSLSLSPPSRALTLAHIRNYFAPHRTLLGTI